LHADASDSVEPMTAAPPRALLVVGVAVLCAMSFILGIATPSTSRGPAGATRVAPGAGRRHHRLPRERRRRAGRRCGRARLRRLTVFPPVVRLERTTMSSNSAPKSSNSALNRRSFLARSAAIAAVPAVAGVNAQQAHHGQGHDRLASTAAPAQAAGQPTVMPQVYGRRPRPPVRNNPFEVAVAGHPAPLAGGASPPRRRAFLTGRGG